MLGFQASDRRELYQWVGQTLWGECAKCMPPACSRSPGVFGWTSLPIWGCVPGALRSTLRTLYTGCTRKLYLIL
jgi:hypothetical protein